MTQKQPVLPTEAELEILSVLWQRGASTVRDVHETMAKTKKVGLTTVLKFLQIMAVKGLVVRDETRRPQLFAPSQSEEETQKQMTRNLMDRAFRGSAHRLVMQALNVKDASPEELQAIRQLLDSHLDSHKETQHD